MKIIASYLHYVVLFGAPLLLLAILMLIIVTICVVPPYFNARTFPQSTCRVVKIEQLQTVASCSAGTDSFSPCVKVFVSFAGGNGEIIKEAVIMENEEALLNCKQCSYTFGRHSWLHSDVVDCESWREDFDRQKCINQFLDRFASYNRTYPCYFNPLNHSQVIHTLSLNLNVIIHGYVWPLLLCLIYGSTCVFIFHFNNQRRLQRKVMLKKYQRNGDKKTKREWKKEELNRCLGLQLPGRRQSQFSSAALETLSTGQILDESVDPHDDMRHLDLAVTEQNIDVLAATFAAQHARTLPRKSNAGGKKYTNICYSTLPISLDVSKTGKQSNSDYWNETYDHGDSTVECVETVSVTTSNMLTEYEIDALFKAQSKEQPLKSVKRCKKKSETAV